ncbi:serine-rich adhesin for platelets isoform X3 [Thunnus maccoyii]|uniref:serine-rich adhesin for platelets isoform X3 n=1 Tax=Thunnus maccoyii TaxID=8240 RepID=UPI001C4BF7C9|nr:serine-rich adhesin for platelets isoform X3 [Thunnus maccoyii]
MAPGLRSGQTGHPEEVRAGGADPAAAGARSPRRTDTGGEGRCLRTKWRAGAAGMLANCLLSAGMLLLLVRCALAAEEKTTYDASGSSSLPSDPTVKAAPAHPLADLSVAEEVPFSVVHSDGDSESEGEGLSGQPAFSSVLTVMAGTVKHPVSLAQGRTSPTVTRDETHTTQWPLHSSSQGSEMSSSSSSSVGANGNHPDNSGLTSSMSPQHTIPPKALTMASGPSHVSLMDRNGNVSSFSPSSLLSSSLSSSTPSTSSVLPSSLSLFSLLSSTQWSTKAASSQGQRIVSSSAPQRETATLAPAVSLDWTESLTAAQSTAHSAVNLPAATQPAQSTTTAPSLFHLHEIVTSETSIEESNKVTTHLFYPSTDKIHGVSGTHIGSLSTRVIRTPANSTYSSYSTSNNGLILLKISPRATQAHNPGMNLDSANNREMSTSFPSNQESQAQRQQGALQNPTSALLSAPPEGYSVSSHVTEQMLYLTTYAENKDKTGVGSQTSVHKNIGDAIMSPLHSHLVNPSASPAMTFSPTGSFFTLSSKSPPGKTTLSETAITKLTPFYSGMVSLEHASNPDDLLMAAGHGSARVPAINIDYNQEEIARAELTSVSSQAYLNNSLSPTQLRPESTTGSILRLISRTGTISSSSESDSLHLQSNEVINVHEQTGSPKSITQKRKGWTTPKMIFSSNSGTAFLSSSALLVEFTNDMTYKTMHESLSHTTRPTYSLPFFLSHGQNHNNTDDSIGLSVSSEVNFSDQAKAPLSSQMIPSQRPFQTRSVPPFLDKFYTTSGLTLPPDKSAEVSAHIIKSEIGNHSISSTVEGKMSAGNIKISTVSNDHRTHENRPAENLHRYTANRSVAPLFNGNEDSTLIRGAAFYKKGVPSGQFLSFMTPKDVFMLNKGSDSSSKVSFTKIPFSLEMFDAALETSLSHKDDGTLMGHNEQPSPSSWSEIILTPRTNSSSRSQGLITSVSSDKSPFYLGRQTTMPSTASSAATATSNEKTFRAIYSFGTKLMAPYTKWKATKPEPFQNSAFESENTSTGFDRGNSNIQADGPSYEHPMLENGQQPNMHVLNSTDPTVVASDPYSFHPLETEHFGGEYSSLIYVKSTSKSKEQSLDSSPADLSSAPAVSVSQRVTVNTPAPSAWGSNGFLPLSHTSSDSVKSSQATTFALVYKNKLSSPLAAVDFPKSVFDTAVTLPNNPSHTFSDTDHTVDLKWNRFISPTELMPSSSSSETSPPSFSGITASQLQMNPTTSLLSKASSSLMSSSSLSSSKVNLAGVTQSTKPAMHPGPVLLSVTPSPNLTSSIDSDHSQEVTFFVLTEAERDELTAGSARVVAPSFPKEKDASLAPSQSARTTLSAGPTERTSQVSPLIPRQDTTTASAKLTTPTLASATKSKNPITTIPSLRVTTGTTQSTTTTTPQPAPVTRKTTTTTTVRAPISRRTFTPPVPRTTLPRGATTIFISPFTTTTEAPPQQCNITERMWVRTVVSIYVRRNRLDSIQRQNLRRGLSQGLRKALNDSSAQAQVETVFGSPNMTVAYHVTGADMVYPPSVVLDGLDSYGRDKLIADLRQYLPMVTALPLPVALWRPSPATGFQLKTVLQFVGAGDDPRSCRFSQMMEQRLEKVFTAAQAKVLNTNNRLSAQMLSVSQAAGSPAVSLVYTVRNGTVFLNGTTASNLLGQLSAELVGYFLFYPPLVIAEPLEYHNLNTSVATRDFWVITVIQDVDNASLEGQYQSFASLMEQRLAELFVLAGQQGTRFRRATTVGSYTVQMVNIRRVSGLKNPAEMTYYVQHNGVPLAGTSAAKVLNTVDSQTMALTLGYFVQLQAEPVVKNPPNNLWIIAAVLAPIAVVTLIIIIITAVLCRKNKNDFKADAIGNLNPRAKMAYRRDVGYYHQPVQGFDYAKQHLGQQGGDEETLPASQDTLVMSLQIRDTPLSLEKTLQQDGTANKKSLTVDKHKSKLLSEDGSVISNESERLNSGRGLTVPKVTAQQKLTKEETRKRDDPYDTSSGSLQLISIKPMAAQPNYSHPTSSDRSQDSAVVNGEVSLALKQKSDIEHYRNKLRLKAKRKGYYDFPSTDGSSSGRALAQRQRQGHERAAGEHGRPMEPDDERGSTYVKSHRRHSQVGQTAYRSRQSLSSPSPGGTEMDLLVMRERPRRGIRNSGYDTEPELIEETNVDRLMGQRGYMYGRGLKGHSETSTLSSQPSIDEVRQQMHLLLEEAFSLASGGQSTSGRHSHHHHHPPPDHHSPAPPPLPYADVVTSAPGTMSCGRGRLQWVPSYGAEVYQCSLPKPAFRFTQLPDMAMSSPPPLPPRTGPPPGTSLRRSTSDLGPKGRSSETSVTEMQSQHDNNPYGPTARAALPSITAEQPVSNYSGNPITAVYAIPATRPGYSEYFVSTPTTSYHSPSWMSYPPEPEDVPPQWADSISSCSVFLQNQCHLETIC